MVVTQRLLGGHPGLKVKKKLRYIFLGACGSKGHKGETPVSEPDPSKLLNSTQKGSCRYVLSSVPHGKGGGNHK